MRKCGKCEKEFEDDVKFCPNCGAEWSDEKKKMSFGERRRNKDREKDEILAKSHLRAKDILDVEECDHSQLQFKYVGLLKKIYKSTIVWFSLAVTVFALCCAGGIGIKFVKTSDTIKILTLTACFMLGFVSVSIFMNRGYQIKIYRAMLASSFAMKKISYGKPARVNYLGNIFEVTTTQQCDKCLQTQGLHIEEFEGGFYAVCDGDRGHLWSLNAAKVKDIAQGKCELDDTKIKEKKHGRCGRQRKNNEDRKDRKHKERKRHKKCIEDGKDRRHS